MRTALIGLSLFFGVLSASGTALAQAPAEDDRPVLSGGFDLIELRESRGSDRVFWDGSFAWGNTTDQAVLMIEGGGEVGTRMDDVQARLLYSRAIGGNAVLLVGVRHEFRPHPHASYAVLGAQGQVGSRLSWESFAFLSDDGQLTGNGKLIYQLPLTDRLYLEPRGEIAWSAQRDEADGLGAGLTDAQASIRLRLKLNDKVNGYLGVAHERLLADSRDLGRAQGEALQTTMAVIGFGFSL
ncbi:MAG TPA: copper resistance protein B [Sphingobium sp.]|nr:copper resistance protein B [Sphingobium sp.]